ncbi:MAG: class I SAM-dependent RNA methyltransferase [Flavobacteriales bacterium]
MENQSTQDFTQFELSASTYAGLEELLSEELRSIGAADVKVRNRLVSFKGDLGFIYKSNLQLRLALRVYYQVKRFQFTDKKELYEQVKKIEWEKWINPQGKIWIHANSDAMIFNNSMYVSQLVKDAIADRFREKSNQRPDISKDHADVMINVHVHRDYCTVNLDTSGESLHKRGYRVEQVEAPMSEVLAAAMVKFSNWTHHFPLLDYMCGSATISIEAALLALKIPPGYFRKRFAFKGWKNFDAALFEKIAESLAGKILDVPLKIKAADISKRNLEIARQNIAEAGLEEFIQLEQKDFFKQHHDGSKAFLLLNPPYDERLPLDDVNDFYKSIGDKMKTSFSGCEAYIISGNLDAAKQIGLRPHMRKELYNGPIPSKLLGFRLYEGTKKIHKLTPQD